MPTTLPACKAQLTTCATSKSACLLKLATCNVVTPPVQQPAPTTLVACQAQLRTCRDDTRACTSKLGLCTSAPAAAQLSACQRRAGLMYSQAVTAAASLKTCNAARSNLTVEVT